MESSFKVFFVFGVSAVVGFAASCLAKTHFPILSGVIYSVSFFAAAVSLTFLYDCICEFLKLMDDIRRMLTNGFSFSYTKNDGQPH